MAIAAKIREVAERHGLTPAQLAIAWALHQGDDIVPIPGTKRRTYLEENTRSATVALGVDTLAEIDDAVRADLVAGPCYNERMMAYIDRSLLPARFSRAVLRRAAFSFPQQSPEPETDPQEQPWTYRTGRNTGTTAALPSRTSAGRPGRLVVHLKQPGVAQQRVLADVIDMSAGSVDWRERGYDAVAAEPGLFRSVLPIMRYDDFVPEIERETRTKGGTLTCSPVLRWLKTSGTTGVPKLVPYTLHWLLTYRIPAMKAMWGTYLEYHPELLYHPYATLDTQTVREDVFDFVHGIGHQAVSNRHPQDQQSRLESAVVRVAVVRPGVPSADEGRMYHRIRHLVGRDLHYISAINPSTLISLRDLLAAHGTDLVRDLREGTLEGRPYTEPDERAARHLEEVLRKPDFSLKDVWPSLTLYTCWLSASAGLYAAKLDAVFPGVDKLPFMSCGTRGSPPSRWTTRRTASRWPWGRRISSSYPPMCPWVNSSTAASRFTRCCSTRWNPAATTTSS